MKSAESLVAANMQTTAGREYEGQIAKEFAEKFDTASIAFTRYSRQPLPTTPALFNNICCTTKT